MEAWIGPAIIAAVISSIVTVASWFVGYGRERRLESSRRKERIQDIQTALLAEIAGNRAQHTRVDLEAHASDMRMRISNTPDYTPFVPRDASTMVFEAVLPEIHILPSDTIFPVVSYYKQVMRIAHFVDDLKSEGYVRLSPDRKIEMYLDYLSMIVLALEQADVAEQALRTSLSSPAASVSSQASGHQSASGSASAAASNQTSSKSPLDNI